MKLLLLLFAAAWLLIGEMPARAADIGYVNVVRKTCDSITIAVTFKSDWKDSPRPNQATYLVSRNRGPQDYFVIHQSNDSVMQIKKLNADESYNLVVEAMSRQKTGIPIRRYRKVGEITEVTPKCGGASPVLPAAVRLRHERTGKCIFGNPVEGGPAKTFTCWADPLMAIFLDSLGGQEFRLRLQIEGKCLYAEPRNGGTVRNFTCWEDPNMVFIREDLGNNRARFRHKASGQCMYGESGEALPVRNWGCWDDPNMVWVIDPF